MPASDPDYAYDVFISYSHADQSWVREWLLAHLEEAGLRVCIDFRDFDVGMPSLVNMERAAREIAALLRHDYERLMTVLYAIEPG